MTTSPFAFSQIREDGYHQHVQDIWSALEGELLKLCPWPSLQPGDLKAKLLQPDPQWDASAQEEWAQWAHTALQWLDKTQGQQILDELAVIQERRNAVTCGQCGVCCNLANSNDSWERMLQKAEQDDPFAQQFTQVFLPYPSVDAARKVNPTVVDEVCQYTDTDTVYFYFCPHLDETNRCRLFGDPRRPEMCDQYPTTPLNYIQPKCHWKPWQEEFHSDALRLQVTLTLAQHICATLQFHLQQMPRGA